jgi:hypothetical protein
VINIAQNVSDGGPMSESSRLRAKAKHTLRLAASILDERTATALRKLAGEYVERAEALEREPKTEASLPWRVRSSRRTIPKTNRNQQPSFESSSADGLSGKINPPF